MSSIVLLEGRVRRLVWGADSSGTFRARDYFDRLDPKLQIRFQPHFERMAATGVITNTEHFRHERGNLFCFKIHKHRLACFNDKRDLVLIEGFGKKDWASKRTERCLRRAERLRDDYLRRKGATNDAEG